MLTHRTTPLDHIFNLLVCGSFMGIAPSYIHTIAYAPLLYCLAWYLFNGFKLLVHGWLTFGFYFNPTGMGVDPCGHPTGPLENYGARLSHEA
jgi:hypothetical protein